MGLYLTSVGRDEWRRDDWSSDTEEPGGYGRIAVALDEELRSRGRPAYLDGSDDELTPEGIRRYSEKCPTGDWPEFELLVRSQLSRPEADVVLNWTILVPVPVDPPWRTDVWDSIGGPQLVVGVPELMGPALWLADVIGLPEQAWKVRPEDGFWSWLEGRECAVLQAEQPGLWSEEPGLTHYLGLWLRAAEYSRRRGCPMAR